MNKLLQAALKDSDYKLDQFTPEEQDKLSQNIFTKVQILRVVDYSNFSPDSKHTGYI